MRYTIRSRERESVAVISSPFYLFIFLSSFVSIFGVGRSFEVEVLR